MKILKDERVSALNDAIALCLDAAALYGGLAEVTESQALADALRKLAERRRAVTAKLSIEVRRLDDLPAAPPQDERAMIESAAAKMKAALAKSGDGKLREEVAAKEAAIRAAASALRGLDLSAEALAAAKELEASAAEGLRD